MFRRIPRVRVGAIACAATLGLVSLLTPVSASAAPAANPNLTYMFNYFNQMCLDGREGPGGVTLQPCDADGTHEEWLKIPTPGYWELQNVFNGLCLDGREGTGGVTLQRCGTDGTHEDWFHVNVGGSEAISTFEDLFNAECLDGREAPIGVTVYTCGSDSDHEWWAADGAGT
jgi:Ricin-type beta-trefoil lectin domain